MFIFSRFIKLILLNIDKSNILFSMKSISFKLFNVLFDKKNISLSNPFNFKYWTPLNEIFFKTSFTSLSSIIYLNSILGRKYLNNNIFWLPSDISSKFNSFEIFAKFEENNSMPELISLSDKFRYSKE